MKSKIFILIIVIISLLCIYLFSSSKDKTLIGNQTNHQLMPLVQKETTRPPKKIILLIGDGMGINHTTIGRFHLGGPNFNMGVDRMPIHGMVTNHSFNSLYIDSAASATAWATGTRTINGFIGVDHKKRNVTNITELLATHDYISGLVATSSLTHATPAAHYAHVDSRYKEEEIASQLMTSDIRIALGGGQEFFNLEENENATIILNPEQLEDKVLGSQRIIGLFAQDGIKRSVGPTQLAMSKSALSFLEKNSECGKYFLMSEGSQIDWASHDNDLPAMLVELADFNDTVNYMLDFASARDDVLVIVSSDHETGGLTLLDQEKDYVISKWNTDSHSLNQVAIYAYGPGASQFAGKVDQTEIFAKIADLADKTSCSID
jgi:alkaline phosphatase